MVNNKQNEKSQLGIGCVAVLIFGMVCIGIGMLIYKYML